MNKRKLATLVAASFAGLMLSSPSFATDAEKKAATSETPRKTELQNQADSNVPRPLGTPQTNQVENTPAPDKLGEPASRSTGRTDKRAASSGQAIADAKADYKAAVEKCDAQPTGQRSTCMHAAESAQSMAMEKSRHGSRASRETPKSRVPGPQSAK